MPESGIEGRKPEDIGPLVVWLASDDTAHVNGHTFFLTMGRMTIYAEPIQSFLFQAHSSQADFFDFSKLSFFWDLSFLFYSTIPCLAFKREIEVVPFYIPRNSREALSFTF